MLSFFESFLKAAGYSIEDKELTLESKPPEFDLSDFPNDLGGYTLKSSRDMDFISFRDKK